MTEKKVDESWKDKVNVEKTKETPEPVNPIQDSQQQPEDADANDHEHEMPPVDFNLFISSLGMQALMGLGEIENPISNKKEPSLPQAKYLIDTLGMVEEKTKGNLNDQEKQMLEQMLFQLRMKYVELSK
ncbi:MAG: DUF1844 domain-containing protein [Candidatus Omnitrophica bacterium]|nr:DUF1844 domain-containing protein [Candidatus Omnitrophota bacterium]